MEAVSKAEPVPDQARLGRERLEAVLKAVDEQGLLGPRDATIGGRVPIKLLERARERSGTSSAASCFSMR